MIGRAGWPCPARPKQLLGACGIGTFALPFAALGWNVLGIELSPGSVARAEDNAAMNGLSDTCRFLPGPVGSLLHEHLPGCEALFVDPPRKGCNQEFLNQLFAFGPRKVVYVSCNPATQMRDLKEFLAAGYQIKAVQPFDLFPQTRHLECVMVLER